MINKIAYKEYNNFERCTTDIEECLIDRVNEIIGVMNKIRNDIDEFMNDLVHRETISMEKNK